MPATFRTQGEVFGKDCCTGEHRGLARTRQEGRDGGRHGKAGSGQVLWAQGERNGEALDLVTE